MKICILTTSFPRFKGDASGIFIFHLSRWLVKKGANIKVISPHDSGCHFIEKWENIQIHRFPYFFPFQLQRLCYGAGIVKNIKKNFPTILQLPFLCASELIYSLVFFKKNKPDIIHAHWSLPQGLIGIIAKRIFKIPCVTSIHGSDVYGLKSTFFKTLNTIVVRNTDVCTANSLATARIARKICGSDAITVLPMGVDTDYFIKTHDTAHLKQKFKIEGPAILFVGRLIDWKGISYLIKALPEILQRFPAAKALIIGSGPQRDELIRLADAIGVANHSIFIDEMPQAELPAFYSMADIFVLPSIVNENGETEGLGVVLLEAMACGLPVIGSDAGGIPDIIKNGETGLLVRQKDSQDLSNQIIRLLTDEDFRTKMVSNARNFIEAHFSWEIVAQRFLEIYRGLLEGNRSEVKY